jgi:hypothetical protein
MAITSGSRLGPYEILSAVSAGWARSGTSFEE